MVSLNDKQKVILCYVKLNIFHSFHIIGQKEEKEALCSILKDRSMLFLITVM